MLYRKVMPLLAAMLMALVVMPFGAGNAFAAQAGDDGSLVVGTTGGNATIKDAKITISPLTYNGQVQKPVITLTIGQVTLVEGTDYKLEYQNEKSINAGKYKVTIVGEGSYSGKANEQYTIDPKKITPSVTLSKTAFIYNGAVQKPLVTAVKDGAVALTSSDYSVDYASGCKDVGSYGVTVTMKGNYTGATTVKYKINPKGTSLGRLVKGSKQITVKWKKQATLMSTSTITGYQVQLATNKKFTQNKKLVTVKGYGKVAKKVTKLKGGMKYFVKIRTYKTVSGVKYFSKWSKVKAITTKR